MELFQIVVLAIVQGITEFLPISSSAHLLLPAELLGWPDQGQAFDVAVHVGSLLAVLVFFRKDLIVLISSWLLTLRPSAKVSAEQKDNSRLAWFIIIATIPAGLAGLTFGDFIESNLRSVAVVAWTTLIFGVFLYIADRKSFSQPAADVKNLTQMTLAMVLVIGACQALALIPGTSRSGVTITAALMLGIGRVDAARFSFLLSIPIIVLTGGYKALELLNESSVIWTELSGDYFVGA